MCPCFKFVSGFLKIHSLKRHLVLMGKTKTMSKNLIWICSKEQIRLNVMIPLKGYITISEIRSSKKSKLKIQDVTHLIKLLHDNHFLHTTASLSDTHYHSTAVDWSSMLHEICSEYYYTNIQTPTRKLAARDCCAFCRNYGSEIFKKPPDHAGRTTSPSTK